MVILLAEDDPLILMTLETYFTRKGYEVIAANNGREAIKKFEEHNPNIIITDIMMPFYSGLEVISRINKESNKKTIVIVLSALGQETSVKEAFELGADDYLTKPFSLVELSIRIDKLVKMKARNVRVQLNEKV